MKNPSLVLAVSKLAATEEQAGFNRERMIELLERSGDAFGVDRLAALRPSVGVRSELGDVVTFHQCCIGRDLT